MRTFQLEWAVRKKTPLKVGSWDWSREKWSEEGVKEQRSWVRIGVGQERKQLLGGGVEDKVGGATYVEFQAKGRVWFLFKFF